MASHKKTPQPSKTMELADRMSTTLTALQHSQKPAIVTRANSAPLTTRSSSSGSSSGKKTATEVDAIAGRMSSILSTDTMNVLQKKYRSSEHGQDDAVEGKRHNNNNNNLDGRVRSRSINTKKIGREERPRSRSKNKSARDSHRSNHNHRRAKKSVSQSTSRPSSSSPVRVRKSKTHSETRGGDTIGLDLDVGVTLTNPALDVDIDLEEDEDQVVDHGHYPEEEEGEDHTSSDNHAAPTGAKVRQTSRSNHIGRRSGPGNSRRGRTSRQAGSIQAEQMVRMVSEDHAQFREEDIGAVSSDESEHPEESMEEDKEGNDGEDNFAAFAPAKLVLGAVGSAAATANSAASLAATLAWTTGAATAGVARTAGTTTLHAATKTVGTTANAARTVGATTLHAASNTVETTAHAALSAGTTTLNVMGRGATAATATLGISSSHHNDGGHGRTVEERPTGSEVSRVETKKGCYKNTSGLVHTLVVVCLFLLAAPTALASVPPKLGSTVNVESIHEYRLRMNLQPLQYKPRLVSIDMCRDLSDADCEKHDVLLQEHAQKHRDIQKKHYEQRQRQRKLEIIENEASGTVVGATNNLRAKLSESNNFADFQHQLGAFTKAYGSGTHNEPTREEEMAELEQLLKKFNTTRDEHYRRRRQLQGSDRDTKTYNPSVGVFVVPLFLVKFTDHETRPVPDKYEYQILWNLRIRKWIEENSYGRYEAWFDVQDWEVTDNTEKYYAFGTAGRVAKFQDSFYPALNAMDERLGGDWSLYDADGDGVLDNVIMLHSGYAAEEAGNDCTNDRGSNDRIWSHAFSDAGKWTSSNGAYTLRGYMIASSLDLLCDANPAKMGVMTHEYLHTMYLIDLYDTNFNGKGLGNYDIMAYPYGADNTGNTPVHLSVWAKEEIEWQQCTEITTAGEYTLPPAATTDACFKIMLIDYTAWEEYFLLENRQQANFDINFFEPGLMMYHIDDAAEDQDNAGFPELAENWPATGDHYRVAAVQADGEFDLEQGKNIGDEKDQWQPGQKIGPNTDGSTFPNTDSYQQGWVEATGITIEVLEHDGQDVKIKVEFGARSAFSTPVKEREEGSQQHISAYANGNGATSLAEDQFIAGDTHHRISGKIPQLPWYEEWKAEQAAASSGKQCLLPPNYIFATLAGMLSFLFV